MWQRLREETTLFRSVYDATKEDYTYYKNNQDNLVNFKINYPVKVIKD